METLGHYELLSPIGRGGMAEVWLARRVVAGGPGKLVALKRMAAGLASQPKYCEMFEAETRMSMTLSHSNIVQVFDFGTQAGTAYIVMELVDGSDLGSLIAFLRERGRTMPEHVAMFVVGELLRALDYSHNLSVADAKFGLIHRDVSPQNLLVSKSGEVKLTDFGVARLVDEQTSGGQPKGKLRYMAPEQLSGSEMDARVDLYAVGAILYELVSGQLYRDAENMDQLYGQILNPNPVQMDRSVSVQIVNLITGLLHSEPSARIATAAQALSLLRAWPGYCDARDELADLVKECCPDSLSHPSLGSISSSAPSKIPVVEGLGLGALSTQTVRTATAAPLAERAGASKNAAAQGASVTPAQLAELTGPAGQGPTAWGAANKGVSSHTIPQLVSEHTTLPDSESVGSEVSGIRHQGPPFRAIALSLGGVCLAITGIMVAYSPQDADTLGAGKVAAALSAPAGRGAKAPAAASRSQAKTPPVVSSDRAKGPGASPSAHADPPPATPNPAGTLQPEPGLNPSLASPTPALPSEAAGQASAGQAPLPGAADKPDAGDASDASSKTSRKTRSKREPKSRRRKASQAGNLLPGVGQPLPKRPSPPPARTRERVSLRAYEFNFAYVKIAGQQALIEPVGVMRIPVGTHTVYVREAATDPWRSFGRVEVRPQEDLVLRLRRSGSLRVNRQSR